MKVIAADFVVYPIKDMAVAQKFYRDTLGLTVYNESDGWSEYDLGNVTLSIVNSDDMPGGGGAIALAVEDVEATIAELKSAGVDISSEAGESPVCHHATITDPDGNVIWIHHRKDVTSG